MEYIKEYYGDNYRIRKNKDKNCPNEILNTNEDFSIKVSLSDKNNPWFYELTETWSPVKDLVVIIKILTILHNHIYADYFIDNSTMYPNVTAKMLSNITNLSEINEYLNNKTTLIGSIKLPISKI